jgi:pimeloyl-ACP methyl ester carboxylesterase
MQVDVVAGPDGTQLARYRQAATTTSRGTLVMVHATGFCAPMYAPLLDGFEDFDVLALDVRCHGGSSEPRPFALGWDRCAADVAAVLTASSPRQPMIGIGHSMGGALLLLHEQGHPGDFAGLWVFEPIVFPPDAADRTSETADADNPLAAGAERRRPGFESRAAARANFASKPPMQSFDPRALDAYVEHALRPAPSADPDTGPVELCCRPAVEADFYRMGPRHDAWARLGEVVAPVQVVTGAATGFSPALVAPLLVERLPHGVLETHDDCGHFAPFEQPTLMAESIHRWIAAHGIAPEGGAQRDDAAEAVTPPA